MVLVLAETPNPATRQKNDRETAGESGRSEPKTAFGPIQPNPLRLMPATATSRVRLSMKMRPPVINVAVDGVAVAGVENNQSNSLKPMVPRRQP